MKWFLLFLVSSGATIVRVIHSECHKIEEAMQSMIDLTDGKYITHSLIYNPIFNTCDVVITFDTNPMFRSSDR